MPETPESLCVFCGKDCSFFAHCDGCCIGCGDGLMADPHALMIAFVQNIRRGEPVIKAASAAFCEWRDNDGKVSDEAMWSIRSALQPLVDKQEAEK